MNTFEDIDDIISLLNNPGRACPSNSTSISSSSEMFQEDSDSQLIELLNDTSSLQSSYSSYFSTGSLETTSTKSFKNNESATRQSIVSNVSKKHSTTEPTEQDMMDILMKQHSLVKQLNNENIKLINANKNLKSSIKSKDSELRNIQESYLSLVEQNKSLKDQLSISQVYNVAYLKQIKLSNKEISSMSIKQLIKSSIRS